MGNNVHADLWFPTLNCAGDVVCLCPADCFAGLKNRAKICWCGAGGCWWSVYCVYEEFEAEEFRNYAGLEVVCKCAGKLYAGDVAGYEWVEAEGTCGVSWEADEGVGAESLLFNFCTHVEQLGEGIVCTGGYANSRSVSGGVDAVINVVVHVCVNAVAV